jgi:hypothetical protein
MFLNFLINTSPSLLSLCQPWPTCRARPTYRRQPPGRTQPAAWSARPVTFPPRSLASSSLLRSPWRLRRLTAAALDSDELRRCPLLSWCSIDRSSDGDSACPRDLIDCLLDARIPFRPRSSRPWPWRPRACSRAARPCPWWDLGLVSWVLRRRIVGVFPWLDAVVAALALPRHATVVSPGCCVSAPSLLLLLCISLKPPGACFSPGACSMTSWSSAPCPTGALLRAGHAHLELALAKLTWSLYWPCSSGACAGQIPPPSAVLGFIPNLHWCCAIQLAVMCAL